jgi:LuxR family transcriptional regulator, maltose regulon positive regulatory protein
MAEGAVDKPPVTTRRRIIERPRLTRLLDESQARIKMLVAPAGYGKTTLARQWLSSRPQDGAWVVVNPSSVDVAALSRAVQRAAAELVPGAGEVLLERLAVTADSDREAETLAEILASELTAWDPRHWIVIDDYHLIAGLAAPERFVESLLLRSPVNVLLLSRQRPSWATARRMLYGEIYEVERSALAMNWSEASTLLDMDKQSARQLVSESGGWPAVLSLASLASTGKPTPPQRSLYRFFAEELYQRIGADAQHGLCRIALVNVDRREQLLEFLGDDAEHVIESGLAHGFLAETPPDRIELHPLLRSFLFDKLRAGPREPVLAAARQALEYLVRCSLWEEALDVAEYFDENSLLPDLDERSLERLLASGRTTTLRRWLARSADLPTAPELRLAAAELAFREGHYYESETMAALASEEFGEGSSGSTRSMIVGARAAHAASGEERAIALYRKARASATSSDLERSAALGELAAAVELESPTCLDLYEEIGPPEDLEPHERVAYVGRGLNLQARFGLRPSFDLARSVAQLLHLVDDPVARSSFRNVFAHTLASSGEYDEALAIAEELLDDADRCRLDFVIPYAQCVQAVVHSSRRDFVLAEQLLDAAESRARQAPDLTAQYIAASIRIRTLIAQGAADAAIQRPMIASSEVTRSLRSELLASLALGHAVAGSHDRALELAGLAESLSVATETTIMTPLARGITSLRRQEIDESRSYVAQGVLRVAESGLTECLVCAYRACPELLMPVIQDEAAQRTIADAMYRAGDTIASGPAGAVAVGSISSLSPREKEVLGLLGYGLTNSEIAARLFISPVTVKVHVRHIFEKLGVRTRTAAALRATQLTRG